MWNAGTCGDGDRNEMEEKAKAGELTEVFVWGREVEGIATGEYGQENGCSADCS